MYYRTQDDDKTTPQALIPPVAQPKGWSFLVCTWSGRIILLNTIVYIITAFQSDQLGLLSVDLNVLLAFGAKDPILLAKGEYWRLVTPMFIHGGFLHYALNNWALYVLAYQLEYLLKPGRFLLLYLLAGLGGTMASSLTSLVTSVGASGALFGLLGCGLYVERTIQSRIKQMTGYKPRTGAYTGMVVANILFGFIIPQIDNAAHIGGLLVGVTFAYVLLRVKANRLMPAAPRQGWLIAGLLGFVLIGGSAVGSSPRYVLYRLQSAIQAADRIEEKYYYLSRLLELAPDDMEARTERLAIALEARDYPRAEEDARDLLERSDGAQRLVKLQIDLQSRGLKDGALWLEKFRQGSLP